MRVESHKEAFKIHKRAIFEWALEVVGLEKSQRIVGLHASRGIIELLSIFLHQKNLIDEGFQINHRWFKSGKVSSKFPDFDNKSTIMKQITDLENLCEILAYGKEKPQKQTEKAIKLFKELETLIGDML